MRAKGYSPYFAPKVVKETIIDFKETKDLSFKQKMWAYKRGFLSNRISRYGLNEENYRNYLPDFAYYKLHPINGYSSKWIDDKLTLKYILSPFNDYLPRYFFQLKNGKVFKLMDCPKEYDDSISGVLSLLKQEGNLAVKLIAGALGKGFYKLSYLDGEYAINNKVVKENEIISLLEKLDNYILTEYLISHKSIRRIFDGTANNLRVMLINDNNQNHPEITGAFIKFGTKNSGIIEHVWAGGIFCKVDLQTGYFSTPKRQEHGEFVTIDKHPDTGVSLEGQIPYWNEIKGKLFEIINYVPQLRYIGIDILITDNGFKIIEMNSHQGINLMQVHYPLLENDYSKKFFENQKDEKN